MFIRSTAFAQLAVLTMSDHFCSSTATGFSSETSTLTLEHPNSNAYSLISSGSIKSQLKVMDSWRREPSSLWPVPFNIDGPDHLRSNAFGANGVFINRKQLDGNSQRHKKRITRQLTILLKNPKTHDLVTAPTK